MRARAAIIGLALVAVVDTSRAIAQESPVRRSAQEAVAAVAQPGASIRFDSEGVDFGPWLREFIAKVRRGWLIPVDAARDSGHVVVSFYVAKSGEIAKVKIKERSRVDAFNDASRSAIAQASPAPPLPKDYRRSRCFFVVTFFYNEAPPSLSPK